VEFFACSSPSPGQWVDTSSKLLVRSLTHRHLVLVFLWFNRTGRASDGTEVESGMMSVRFWNEVSFFLDSALLVE
jgi:hypothetical protein